MQLAAPTEDEAIVALEQLKRTVRIAFCSVMQSTRLPPMAALSFAAMAVGSLYGEVAAAHRGEKGCCCGREPRRLADLEALQTSLSVSADGPRADIHAIEAVGTA